MSSLDNFLSYFQEIEPPITLTDESIDHITAANDALPQALIDEFIKKWDTNSDDEFTEYVSCFRWQEPEFHVIVYWKAGLMRYEYFIVTLKLNGEFITKKPLCGTIIEGDLIKKSVARIEANNSISIVAGATLNLNEYSGEQSQTYGMEITKDGNIYVMVD